MSAAFWNGIIGDHADAQMKVARRVNCFGIPDYYRGCPITQGPDDNFYAASRIEGWNDDEPPLSAPTWEALQDKIDAWFEEPSA